jgi:hypothetical protein
MFRRRKNRIGAAVALAAVLALGLAAPAGAVGWGGWGEARELAEELLPRLVDWLGLAPGSAGFSKCDHGGSIDPNGGCPKSVPKPVLKCDQGGHIDPNGGCPKGTGVRRQSGPTMEDSLSRGQL